MRLWANWSSWRCPCSLQRGWTKWPLKVPFNPNYSLIPCCIGVWEVKHKTSNPAELSGHLFAPKPSDRAPYLSGISAHKMSQQLIVLAVISGFLHGEIVPICHRGGQEAWHVVKCLVVKKKCGKKGQGLGVGTVHRRHKECNWKQKPTNKKKPDTTL